MKHWVTLYAFVLMALALMPCTDAAEADHQEAAAALCTDAPGDPCGDHRPCSPLCTCHCCQIHLTMLPLFPVATQLLTLGPDVPEQASRLPEGTHPRLLHPPQAA